MPPKTHHTPEAFAITTSARSPNRWRFVALADRSDSSRLAAARDNSHTRPGAGFGFCKRQCDGGPENDSRSDWIDTPLRWCRRAGLNVLTDPIFSLRASPVQFLGPARAQPPGIALADLPRIDCGADLS